jgi:hypothetical protein
MEILGREQVRLGVPLSPRSIALIELAGNRQEIYGAQSLTGKNLDVKELKSVIFRTDSKAERMPTHSTVTASTMIAQF